MMPINLDALGLPLFEMRCPVCNKTQQTKVRHTGPHLTRCCHCKTVLVYSLHIQEKPNNVLLTLVISPVPEAKKDNEKPTRH